MTETAKQPTPAMLRALKTAAGRPRGTICPIGGGVHAAAETALLQAMDRRGLIAWDGPVPFISATGLAAIARAQGKAGA